MTLQPIENLLEWQKMIDDAPASINMRGCARFWLTVGEKLGRRVWIDGSPDITAVAIELEDGVALLLEAEGAANADDVKEDGELFVWKQINYRFVALADLKHFMSGEEWKEVVLGQFTKALGSASQETSE